MVQRVPLILHGIKNSEDIEAAYAMLKSSREKITGAIYLSNGQAPSEEEQQQDAGSRKSLNLRNLKTSWKICMRWSYTEKLCI